MKSQTLEYAPVDLLFKAPLYTSVADAKLESMGKYARSLHLGHTSANVDNYCPFCKKDTTWQRSVDADWVAITTNKVKVHTAGHYGDPNQWWLDPARFIIQYACSRNPQHLFEVNFYFDKNLLTLRKVGQYPSMADMLPATAVREELLDEISRREYREAGILASYGFNVASFLYLRRVVENLVAAASVEAESEEKDFDKERFVSAKFKDRIKMLGERIPQFLADTPELYPVLSEGVHQWDNATCEKALPILRMAIEIVLAEAAEKKEKARRDREVKVQLQKLHGGNKGAAL